MPHSDLQLQRLGVRPLASIPNQVGCKIIGVKRDNTEVLLVVELRDGFHSVPGYSDLIGWKRA